MMVPYENPGLVKLIEEMGEALQEAAKLLAYPEGTHPDGRGNLRDRLAGELGDVRAAISFVCEHCLSTEQLVILRTRMRAKGELYEAWHSGREGNGL